MAAAIVGTAYCDPEATRELTVRKTSLFYPGDGFAVYEHGRHGGLDSPNTGDDDVGELIFRVDSYGGDRHGTTSDDFVLMDPAGGCILTLRRKRPSLHHRWEAFAGGEESAEQSSRRPLFSVRRPSIIGGSGGFLVEVLPSGEAFHVEGSYPQRCCTLYKSGDKTVVVARIKRKVDARCAPGSTSPGNGVVVLGRDVFVLSLSPGFDAAFAMGIILALDRITGDDDAATGVADACDQTFVIGDDGGRAAVVAGKGGGAHDLGVGVAT